MRFKIILKYFLIATMLLLLSCSKNPKMNKTAKHKKQQITLSEGWMRPAAINRNSACFLKITNNSDLPDTLIGVSSKLAKIVQFHLSYNNDDGTMGMKQVFAIPINSNSEFYFKPGSYHIMLIGMNKTMPINSLGRITLTFKNAGAKIIKLEVKDSH